MSYEGVGQTVLDYQACTYDGSRLHFRGPKYKLDEPYIAFLGATETFGKFIDKPYPDLLAEHVPVKPVNLGMINGGLDAYLNDPGVLEVAKGASLRVVQVMGALNLSNHYFKVHPRRNDRFIAPHDALRALYPSIDFAQFHFTKAMLRRLQSESAEKYAMICRELQDIWLARLTVLLKLLGGDTILMWFAENPPPKNAIFAPQDPMLVDAEMIARVREKVSSYIEVVPASEVLSEGTDGMTFGEWEMAAAKRLMGPSAHAEAALALQEPCLHYIK